MLWLAIAAPVSASNIVSYNDDATVTPPLPFGSLNVRADSLLNVGTGNLALDGANVFPAFEDIDER